jgi:hypothetical protein
VSDPVRAFCASCGAELPAWFKSTGRIYDVAKDDEDYERWLDAPCASCGLTPRENGQS